MTVDTSLTPFELALQLRQQGKSDAEMHDALRARGLDADELRLLIKAVHARAPDAPPPVSEWVSGDSMPLVGATPLDGHHLTARETAGAAASSFAGLPCGRCGTFLTADSGQLVLGKAYCKACAERPEINYPKAFRDRYWLKRDGWAWFFGMSGLWFALSSIGNIFSLGDLLPIILGAFLATIQILFWARVRAARALIFIPPAFYCLAVLVTGLSAAPGLGGLIAGALGTLPGVFSIWVAWSAINGARNQLFFGIEPSEDKLAAAWLQFHDNRVAKWGRALSMVALLSMAVWIGGAPVAGLVTLGVAVTGIGLSAVGFSRVNPDAQPPVGQRGAALFGIIVGAISLLSSVAYLVATRR